MPDLIDSQLKKSDLVMIRSAIRRGWKIPTELMERLPQKMAELVEDADPRTVLGATKVLVAMHGQNQKDEPLTRHIEHHHEHELGPVTEANIAERKRKLAERIARLG